ncbi:MAG: TrkA C-terminal domain-containing protein [Euryarchaeota archaeon]|nr:TrkA C-terminal domain-containing protein [Euryarchaeota archaeon]
MLAAFITLFAVIIISLIITRVATIALTLTGMSWEVARFQARSAFTGAGFTTAESEKMMRHPIRRRILMILMLAGNAGIVTVIASAVLVFVNPASETWQSHILVIIIGVTILLAFTQSKRVDKHLTRIIVLMLRRWTEVESSDSASLMYLGGDYQVSELEVESEDWLADETLADLHLRDEGVLVLGIQKPGGQYHGAPIASTRIRASDVLLLYGRGEAIHTLDRRRKGLRGKVDHAEAVDQQKQVIKEQEARDSTT